MGTRLPLQPKIWEERIREGRRKRPSSQQAKPINVDFRSSSKNWPIPSSLQQTTTPDRLLYLSANRYSRVSPQLKFLATPPFSTKSIETKAIQTTWNRAPFPLQRRERARITRGKSETTMGKEVEARRGIGNSKMGTPTLIQPSPLLTVQVSICPSRMGHRQYPVIQPMPVRGERTKAPFPTGSRPPFFLSAFPPSPWGCVLLRTNDKKHIVCI